MTAIALAGCTVLKSEKQDEATSEKTLAALVATDESIEALLEKVDSAYMTDPVAATQIAAISQRAMCVSCAKSPMLRTRWTEALLAAAWESREEYRTLFLLDQLRWCGYCDDAAAVRAIGEASKSKAVADFAVMVARELDAAR